MLKILNKTSKQFGEYNSKLTVYRSKNKKVRDVPLISNLIPILQDGFQEDLRNLQNQELNLKKNIKYHTTRIYR